MSNMDYDIEKKYTISLKTFRNHVDGIKDPRDSVLLKTCYLGAFRACELLTRTTPSELLQGKSKPYGTFQTVSLEDYIVKPAVGDEPAQIEKILLIRSAIAKRTKRMRKKDQRQQTDDNETLTTYTDEELTQAFMRYHQKELLSKAMNNEITVDPRLVQVLNSRIKFKEVAVPTDPRIEPWCVDLVRWIAEQGKKTKKIELQFNLTRKSVWQIMRKRLNPILPPKSNRNLRNPLRHFRATHLYEYYKMTPQQIMLITGWTARTTYAAAGMSISSNFDAYLHTSWRSYVDKLLIPIKQFL